MLHNNKNIQKTIEINIQSQLQKETKKGQAAQRIMLHLERRKP